MRLNKKCLAVFFTVSILTSLVGVKVEAVDADKIREQIAALQAQIAQLLVQLEEAEGAPVAWCHDFNIKMGVGSQGTEVKALQNALHKEGFAPISYKEGDKNYGRFEEYTASAVTGFQQKYEKDVLAPWGLKYGTGYAGSTTLKKLTAIYGCGGEQPTPIPEPTPEPICIVEGGKGIAINGDACCKGLTSISNSWASGTTCVAPTNSSFVCSYCGNGICGLGENTCNCPKDCSDESPEKSIAVTYPNGGENWVPGQQPGYHVGWTSTGDIEQVGITLLKNHQPYCEESSGSCLASSVVSNAGSYTWFVSDNFATGTDYTIKIEDLNDATVYDESDGYFNIVVMEALGFKDIENQLANVSQAANNLMKKIESLLDR